MGGRIVIFGYGPTGRATAERLLREGREVVVAQRHAPAALPPGATFVACDALDRDAVLRTARKGEQFVVTIGFAYRGEVWREAWPKAIGNFVAACEATGAHGVHRQSLHVRAADGAARRGHAAHALRSEAGGAFGGDPRLDGGVR